MPPSSCRASARNLRTSLLTARLRSTYRLTWQRERADGIIFLVQIRVYRDLPPALANLWKKPKVSYSTLHGIACEHLMADGLEGLLDVHNISGPHGV